MAAFITIEQKSGRLDLFKAKAFLKFRFLISMKARVVPQRKQSNPFFRASQIGTSERMVLSLTQNNTSKIKIERITEICQTIFNAFLSC